MPYVAYYTYPHNKDDNITSKKEYALASDGTLGDLIDTNTYTYSTAWKDMLTNFDGQQITYDALGNPAQYRGNTLAWTKVRRLASYGSNTFEYGADGIRFKKNNTTCTLDGSKILRETDGTKTLTYYYGTNGVVGFNYNGVDYYYQTNQQGDELTISEY